jgi:hypothetical protein
MPITIQWDDDTKRVIRFDYIGRWNWNEYHASISEAHQMTKDMPYTVNMILDFSNGTVLPTNALSHFGASMKAPPGTFDLAVIVTESRFIEAVVSLFCRVYPRWGKKFEVVETLEAARQVYAKRANQGQSETAARV